MRKDLNKIKDPYSPYRHINFQYLSYYLNDFFNTHHIKKHIVEEDSEFGGKTLSHLLDGKDMHFNCYLRLLAVMGEYCKGREEFLNFIMEFMKRAIIEIWLIWEEDPVDWMVETWEKMQEEKEKHMVKKHLIK